tara:strand:- start:54 stop:476 length:423 start_codon:yes stop_codon:yes gene_type:complete
MTNLRKTLKLLSIIILDFYIKGTQTYGFLLYNIPKTKMIKYFYKSFFPIAMMVFLFIALPNKTYAESFNNLGEIFMVSQQKSIINYEKSQPSSIDNPVVDPNFNTMRAEDAESSTATYIVVGLLVAATIIPLATWWYFSK